MTFPVRVNCSRGQGGVSAKSLIVNVVRVDGVSSQFGEGDAPPAPERARARRRLSVFLYLLFHPDHPDPIDHQ